MEHISALSCLTQLNLFNCLSLETKLSKKAAAAFLRMPLSVLRWTQTGAHQEAGHSLLDFASSLPRLSELYLRGSPTSIFAVLCGSSQKDLRVVHVMEPVPPKLFPACNMLLSTLVRMTGLTDLNISFEHTDVVFGNFELLGLCCGLNQLQTLVMQYPPIDKFSVDVWFRCSHLLKHLRFFGATFDKQFNSLLSFIGESKFFGSESFPSLGRMDLRGLSTGADLDWEVMQKAQLAVYRREFPFHLYYSLDGSCTKRVF
jgi:hypothetical protein